MDWAGLGCLGPTLLQTGSPTGLRAASTERAFRAKVVVLSERGGMSERPDLELCKRARQRWALKYSMLSKVGVLSRRNETSTIRQRSERSRARLSPGEVLGLFLEKCVSSRQNPYFSRVCANSVKYDT